MLDPNHEHDVLILCLNKETIFTPAKISPHLPQGSETTLLTQAPVAPGGVPNSAYTAIPHVPDELSTTLLVPGGTQPSHDFYQYPWFRRLIVLIYGLTLGLAGNVLWFFPYLGLGFSKNLQEGIVRSVWLYAPWVAYNFGIVWIYIMVSLHFSRKNSVGTASSSVPFGPHDRHLNGSRWTGPTTSNILICVLLGSSYIIGGLRFYLWVELIISSDKLS